jgi:hypothetical protein
MALFAGFPHREKDAAMKPKTLFRISPLALVLSLLALTACDRGQAPSSTTSPAMPPASAASR